MTAEAARTELEFWPDYGAGPLWRDGGEPVDLASLDLDAGLRERLRAWNAEHDDARLPIDGDGDPAWLERGRVLLTEIRQALAGTHDVTVHEPWWGEPDPPFRQPGT